jgi:hypothetical protein
MRFGGRYRVRYGLDPVCGKPAHCQTRLSARRKVLEHSVHTLVLEVEQTETEAHKLKQEEDNQNNSWHDCVTRRVTDFDDAHKATGHGRISLRALYHGGVGHCECGEQCEGGVEHGWFASVTGVDMLTSYAT